MKNVTAKEFEFGAKENEALVEVIRGSLDLDLEGYSPSEQETIQKYLKDLLLGQSVLLED